MKTVTVPIIPSTLLSDLINQYHDALEAAHLVPEKTTTKVCHVDIGLGCCRTLTNTAVNALCARPQRPLHR